MFSNFNKRYFLLATVILVPLTFATFVAAFAKDEGTIGENSIWHVLANLFFILRFPTHTLLSELISEGGAGIYYGGLVLNCLFYSFLFERIFYFLSKRSIGVWITTPSIRKRKEIFDKVVNTEIERMKLNGEKVDLNFDNCEFKNGSFSHQVDDPNMNAVKIFAPGPLSSIDTTITETVIQSYLTYTASINGGVCKFISQSFPFDQTTLKYYVLNQSIVLYVDRFNPDMYIFDLKR